ncbi:MAG TPA: hypothetical protein VFQ72_04175 [Candidatus Paceibacterota bacterium]|nr:hypothetical protein [Candidatus Paceibacterota bacterium]
MHPIHFRHWTAADMAVLAQLAGSPHTTFEDLGALALAIVRRHGGPLHMVSGPITTGGFGSIPDNLRVFCGVIEHLADEGFDMFSQRPFEIALRRLFDEWTLRNPPDEYCHALLEGFYRPIYESGCIGAMHFMHGYETSKGALWEFEGCPGWRIERRVLSQEVSLAVHARLGGVVMSGR